MDVVESPQIQQPIQSVQQIPVEPKKKSNTLLVAILLIAILLIPVGVYAGMQIVKKQTPVVLPTAPPQEIRPTEALPTSVPKILNTGSQESYTENTSVSGQKRYVSPKLGISFLFAEKDGNGQKILVKEIGNKVYLYGEKMKYDSGQYVEVFQKDKGQSLTDAIREKFLSGYSSDKCKITVDKTYPNLNYEVVNIEVVGNYDDMEKLFTALKDCPSPYTQSNGISYFLGDKNHPDKFVFFSIGQYLINKAPTGEQGWQDTIEFL